MQACRHAGLREQFAAEDGIATPGSCQFPVQFAAKTRAIPRQQHGRHRIVVDAHVSRLLAARMQIAQRVLFQKRRIHIQNVLNGG